MACCILPASSWGGSMCATIGGGEEVGEEVEEGEEGEQGKGTQRLREDWALKGEFRRKGTWPGDGICVSGSIAN